MTARRHPSPAMVVACVALVIAVAGVAMGAIPGTDGTIKGCYTKTHGDLRVIGSAKKCAKGERALSWNQRGLRGLPGAAGEPGTNGMNGTNGTNGIDGLNGAAIAARARMSGPPVVPPQFPTSAVDVPLTGNTWSQAANEVDLVVGQITYDSASPADCDRAMGHGIVLDLSANGQVFAQIFMNGTFVAGISRPIPADLGSPVGASNILPILFEPGTDTPRTLTATIQQNCGGPTSTHYTINSLKLDVVRLR